MKKHIEPIDTTAAPEPEAKPVHTYHIQLTGIVQGVGFRPLAYTLAKKLHLSGTVSNGNDGLHIFINATAQKAQHYYDLLLSNNPSKSTIIESSLNRTYARRFSNFAIIESDTSNEVSISITPDYAPCDDCLKELYDKNDRRHQYPFITCSQCGPRYSIIKKLPYERKHTSMDEFAMCAGCLDEFNNIHDRRYFSQTNSCNNCGIQLTAKDHTGKIITTGNESSLNSIDEYLKQHKIVAVKGVGGYLLLCNASSFEAIQTLRRRKYRPAKPFAVLCSSMKEIHSLAFCNITEEEYLQNDAAPILLLRAKEHSALKIKFDVIAPGLKTIGVMLPNSPLLHMIANRFGSSLICTSGNISGSPIIFDDEDAALHLSSVADLIVSHNRKITTPQDDSVIKISSQHQLIIIRRARGFSPSLLNIRPATLKTLMSTGALLKSSIGIQRRQQYYVSQYLGSTINFEARQYYQHTWQHLEKILQIRSVKNIISDKHPDYFSTQFGKDLVNQTSTLQQLVQHHKAHLAAVLAENNLIDHDASILCFIADGTGLGDDDNIWGSEFFIYNNKKITRRNHFEYFPLPAGDKMAAEPRLSALSIAYDIKDAGLLLKQKFSEIEWQLYNKILKNYDGILCSSLGRIFDAVASVLNVADKQTYEGEAAMKLESLALDYLESVSWQFSESYFTEDVLQKPLPTKTLFKGIIADILANKQSSYISARFHYSIVHSIWENASAGNVKHIAFSGGVFQNAVLIDLIKIHLQPKFQLYFHQHLSSNDENISFGQLVYAENEMKDN